MPRTFDKPEQEKEFLLLAQEQPGCWIIQMYSHEKLIHPGTCFATGTWSNTTTDYPKLVFEEHERLPFETWANDNKGNWRFCKCSWKKEPHPIP
jgi:hypothetical protein